MSIRRATLITLILVLSYALVTRLIFGLNSLENVLGGVVSLSFIFLTPFAWGALCTYLGYKLNGSGIYWTFILPVISVALGLAISVITQLEAMICVVMAIPILGGMSLLGALTSAWMIKKRTGHRLYLSFVVLLPYLAAPLENQWEAPHEQVSISNSITITATPEEVWPEIASVSAIPARQIHNRWIYWLGFPKPIAATLDHEGVGGIRTATFERGVSFHEVITVWDHPEKLSFSIHADPDFIPANAFDRHIIVGGRFYDVLDGTYLIEPVPEGVKLHLTSTHRLSTRFNSYAGLWSTWIMDQIQGSILEIIKLRCERTHET